MISTFASLFMIFTDRLFLARYSIDDAQRVRQRRHFGLGCDGRIGMITAMSEVFVAQYNGAKDYRRIGVPVWQMIWFALFSYLIFAPLAAMAPSIFAGDFNADLEVVYFRWLMLFGPSYALMTAFAGFFIGRGKTKILIVLAIIANVLNITLDWMFIFGVPPYIPEMGIKGAAIATCLGYLFQACMLAVLFWKKKNREEFGTNRWQLNLAELKKCCKVGIPQGVFSSLEIFGWAVFYWMMTSMGKTHITVSSICQSLLILLSFFFDGLSRGVAAVAGNFIGSRRLDLVYRVMRSGIILQTLFSLAVAAVFLFDPKTLIHLLFFEHIDAVPTDGSIDLSMMGVLQLCLVFSFVYICFEGIRWVFSGLLVAAGDTLFLLIAGSLSVWLGLLLPVYLIVVQNNLSVEYAWLISLVYSLALATVYALRFKQGSWKKIDLLLREIGTESVSSASPKN